MSSTHDAKTFTVTWGGMKFTNYDSRDVLEISTPEDREGAPWVVASVTVPLVRVGPPVNLARLVLSSRRNWKRGQKLNRGGRRRARVRHEAKQWLQRSLRAAYAEIAGEIFEDPPSVKWLESVFPELTLSRAVGGDLDRLGALEDVDRKDGEQ